MSDHCPHCGCEIDFAPVSQRSSADHNMFWATVAKACQSWPHSHRFQPTGVSPKDRVNNLYGWLLVEIGYVDTLDIESHEVHAVDVGFRVARRKKDSKIHYWRLTQTETGWQLITPRSTNKLTAGKRQFEDVRSRVYEIIEVTLGVKVEDLKREAKLAA